MNILPVINTILRKDFETEFEVLEFAVQKDFLELFRSSDFLIVDVLKSLDIPARGVILPDIYTLLDKVEPYLSKGLKRKFMYSDFSQSLWYLQLNITKSAHTLERTGIEPILRDKARLNKVFHDPQNPYAEFISDDFYTQHLFKKEAQELFQSLSDNCVVLVKLEDGNEIEVQNASQVVRYCILYLLAAHRAMRGRPASLHPKWDALLKGWLRSRTHRNKDAFFQEALQEYEQQKDSLQLTDLASKLPSMKETYRMLNANRDRDTNQQLIKEHGKTVLHALFLSIEQGVFPEILRCSSLYHLLFRFTSY